MLKRGWGPGIVPGVLLLWAAPVAAQETPTIKTVTVAFEPLTQHGAPVIAVRLNQTVTARFLVDTGASNTVLTPDVVEKLNLTPQARDGLSFKLVTLTSFAIGDWTLPGGEFPVLSGPILAQLKTQKLDGVLGLNVLRQSAFFLNLEKQECSFLFPPNLPQAEVERLGFSPKDAPPVSLTLEAATAFCFVDVRVDGTPTSLLLDTGHARTVLPHSFAAVFTGKPLWSGALVGVDGTKEEPVYLTSGLTVGGRTGDKQTVTVTNDETGYRTRILGMDFLAQHNLLLDHAARRVYLRHLSRPSASLEANQQVDLAGMVLGPRNGIWQLIALDPTNRLYRRGLRPNDTLTLLNNTDPRTLPPERVITLLRATPSLTLTLQRLESGKPQTHRLTFTR